ncbi:MAG: T9SS type A sorting domain-containing protein [Chitinophagaceae bacterium]
MKHFLPLCLLLTLFFANSLQAQFTPGNLAVFRADVASANNTTFSIVEVNPSLTAQTSPVNIFTINGTTGANALRTSGSATSTGYLSTSNNGDLLCFTAHNSITTSGNANTITARGVGTLDASGNFTLATTYTGGSGNQTRCATTLNNNNWFIADQGGVYTNGTSSASPSGNFRSVKAFGGVAYIFQASASAAPVSSITATSGGTITGLPGLPLGNGNMQDFYMIASGNNGTAYDVLYLLSATSNTAGVIAKYSLVAGSWVANGTYATGFGGFGMAAEKTSTGAALYITTGLGALAANSVLKVTDNAAYNATINITTANNLTLFTAPAGTTLKGIAFAPIISVNPSLAASPSPVNFGSVHTGNTSTAQTLTLTASNLIPGSGSLTVNAPNANFQVFDGTAWGSTATVSYSNGGTTIQSLQVRFAPQVANTFSNSLSISGGGLASPLAVPLTGTGFNELGLSFSTATSTALQPPYVSGTINDITDPAAATGIVLSIQQNGADLAAASYSVTPTSSNTTVVPIANITIAKADGNATVKIAPAAVGYADITLRLANGADAKDIVIHYAASSSTAAAAKWPTGISDASAAIALDDNYMVIGNDETNYLYVFNRNASGLPVKVFDFNAGNLLNLTDGSAGNYKELDLEAAAPSPTVAGKSYWLGSMSNSSSFNDKPNRDRIMAIAISGTGAATSFSNAGYYTGLRSKLIAWGDTHGYDFTSSAKEGIDPKLINGFNAEGVVFAPDNTTLYIGFRAPLVPTGNRTKAVIAPLQNFEAWFNNGNPSGSPVLAAPIELDLGGRGIRDLVKLADGKYIIVAGSYDETSIPALFRWSGNAADAPVLLSSYDLTGLNAEAALGINSNGQLASDQIQIICDNGDNVFYNDATAAKDLSQDNYRKFLTETIASSTQSLLPVHFEYFTAQRKGSDVQLDWKTGITDNAALFDVTRSDNGYSFTSIQKLSSVNNQQAYSFTDINAPSGKLYYRINSRDLAGNTYQSVIRTVAASGVQDQTIRVYPNPVVNGLFSLTVNKPGTKDISIYNSAGVLYQQFTFAGINKEVVTSGWAKGFYLLRITTTDGNTVTQKIVVQ